MSDFSSNFSPDSLRRTQNRIEAACALCGRDVSGVTLLGASKTVDAARLEAFFAGGLRDFGENYVQEGLNKVESFRAKNLGATWHFIGALQSNKAPMAVAHFDLVHSVDRMSLAKELHKEARKIGKVQRVLLQVNLENEDSKAGVSPGELGGLCDAVSTLENLKIEGLMSLPPFEINPEDSRPFHRALRELSESLRPHFPSLQFLSMGMSNDFEVAIEEGATHIRVGTALFGARS